MRKNQTSRSSNRATRSKSSTATAPRRTTSPATASMGNKNRYEITRNNSNKNYQWRLIASNGVEIMKSPGYTKKSDALRTISRHREIVKSALLNDLTSAN